MGNWKWKDITIADDGMIAGIEART